MLLLLLMQQWRAARAPLSTLFIRWERAGSRCCKLGKSSLLALHVLKVLFEPALHFVSVVCGELGSCRIIIWIGLLICIGHGGCRGPRRVLIVVLFVWLYL